MDGHIDLLEEGQSWVIEIEEQQFYCSKKLFVRKEVEKLLSSENFLEEFCHIQYTKALSFSLQMLSRKRMHTVHIIEELNKYVIFESVQEQVIQRLKELFLVDDPGYNRAFIEKEQRAGRGDRVILQKARMKKLPYDEIKKILLETNNEKTQLIEYILKKYKKHLPFSRDMLFKVKQKLFLRGFAYDIINEALQEFERE